MFRRRCLPALTLAPRQKETHSLRLRCVVRIAGVGWVQGGNRPASRSLSLSPRPPALGPARKHSSLGLAHLSLGACDLRGRVWV